MLVYYICAVLVFAAANAQPESNGKFSQFIYERCKRNSPVGQAYDNFELHFYDFKKYSEYAFGLLPGRVNEFCNEERFRLLRSLNTILVDIKPCLPPSEKYLPRFLYTSFEAFTNFTCERNAATIQSFFSTSGSECRSRLAQGNAEEAVRECFRKIRAPVKTDVTKQELCNDISMAKRCVADVLDTHCNEFRAYKQLNKDFFNSISVPCSPNGSSQIASSYLFLFVSFAFILKYFADFL